MRSKTTDYKRHVFAIALGFSFTGALWAADDDYLSAIEAESGKVDARQDKATSDTTVTEGSGAAGSDANEPPDTEVRDKFEKILDKKYHGSYVFYKKLPERSKQEIVQEYKRGTEFVVLRKKIIDRFMQR